MSDNDRAQGVYGDDSGRLKIRLQERESSLKHWLRSKHPDIQEKQRHLDEGTAERAYWHYGYLMAVRDILKLLEGR